MYAAMRGDATEYVPVFVLWTRIFGSGSGDGDGDGKQVHITLFKDQGAVQLHFPRHIPVVRRLCCMGYVVGHVHTYSMALVQQDIHDLHLA